jgi:hypothetical protein
MLFRERETVKMEKTGVMGKVSGRQLVYGNCPPLYFDYSHLCLFNTDGCKQKRVWNQFLILNLGRRRPGLMILIVSEP